jgi:4-alpha-glucanotransferase
VSASLAGLGLGCAALRSTGDREWGFGDLADLRWLADSCSLTRCTAATPVIPHEPSPYVPSSRRFRSPLYLSIEAIPGAEMLRGLDDLVARGRALNSERRLDRDTVLRLKLEALERLWTAAVPSARFDAFRAAHGAPLEAFASCCVLADGTGPVWHGGQPR